MSFTENKRLHLSVSDRKFSMSHTHAGYMARKNLKDNEAKEV